MRWWLGLALITTIVMAGCAPRGPILDTGSKPPGVGGTISGLVRGPGDAGGLSGRRVTAVNVDTGERFEGTTAVNGGYTIQVPVGKYRLEVELRSGESLTEQPEVTSINASDMDASRNFTITRQP
jgi:hypothetical protein